MSEALSLILCVLATVIYITAKIIGIEGTKEALAVTLIMWILHITIWNLI